MKTQSENIISLFEPIARVFRGLILKIRYDGKIIYEPPGYLIIVENKKKGPYCQRCCDVDKRLVLLEKRSDGIYICHQCPIGSNEYEDPFYVAPEIDLGD